MARRIDDTGFGGLKLIQDSDLFCYGTDAVLLADFALLASYGPDSRVCDLGSGNGIVPLIMAKTTTAGLLAGLEIQEAQANLARESAVLNGLEDRVSFFTGDVRDIAQTNRPETQADAAHTDCPETRGDIAKTDEPETRADAAQADDPETRKDHDASSLLMPRSFDVVTANPPYTRASCGIKNPGGAIAAARHETAGTLADFTDAAARLLKDRGSFFMVHRPSRLADAVECARAAGLEPKRIRFVSGKAMEAPNIVLFHFVKNGGRNLEILAPMAVRNADGTFTDEMLRAYGRLPGNGDAGRTGDN